jgi:metal-responsive CopG/Arc/MetJ family transcriptional regulator
MATHISVRIPERLLLLLDALAAKLGISRTDTILNAILLQNTMFKDHNDSPEIPNNARRNRTHAHKRHADLN